jgi:hypothetical protein
MKMNTLAAGMAGLGVLLERERESCLGTSTERATRRRLLATMHVRVVGASPAQVQDAKRGSRSGGVRSTAPAGVSSAQDLGNK